MPRSVGRIPLGRRPIETPIPDDAPYRLWSLGYDGEPTWVTGSIAQRSGTFRLLSKLDLAGNGNVYVLDEDGFSIHRLSATGMFVGTNVHRKGWMPPTDFAVAPSGDYFVMGGIGIQAFDAGRNPLWLRPRHEAEEGDEWAFGAIALAPSGQMLVTDSVRDRIQRYDSEGNFLAEWGATGARNGEFRWPADVAVGADSTVYVADTLNRRIQAFREDGEFLGQWPVAGARFPLVVDVDADGAVYVLVYGDEVHKYGPDGDLIATFGGPGSERGRFLGARGMAAGPDGRVYVSDAGGQRIHLFAPVPGAATSTPEPTPVKPEPCAVRAEKEVSPRSLELGETTQVTLRLSGSCQTQKTPADIMLVVPRGLLWHPEGTEAQIAALSFVEELVDSSRDQIGLVTAASDAVVAVPLGRDTMAVTRALEDMAEPGWIESSDVAAALDAAQAELAGERRIAEAAPVIVYMSGGTTHAAVIAAAGRAKAAGTRVFVITFENAPNEESHSQVASAPADVFIAQGNALEDVFARIDREIQGTVMTDVTVTDRLPDDVAFVPGSAWPEPTVVTSTLVWHLAAVPRTGAGMSYRVRPLRGGTYSTNVKAHAEFWNGAGERQSVSFPNPLIDVSLPIATPTATPTATLPATSTPTASPTASRAPTATGTLTPTATATATPTTTRPVTAVPTASRTTSPNRTPMATPTPVPEPMYLPLLFRELCRSSIVPVDVALAIDTSSSMNGAKLASAAGAARGFVALLDLSRDRAAVVAFDADARGVQGLTGNRPALDRALVGLTTHIGTRIDLGLWQALGEVGMGSGRAGADPIVVLLTDGRPQGGTETAIDGAVAAARELGVTVYAIGLGEDVDPARLERIAGDRSRVFLAPTSEDLVAIYVRIARVIPCR